MTRRDLGRYEIVRSLRTNRSQEACRRTKLASFEVPRFVAYAEESPRNPGRKVTTHVIVRQTSDLWAGPARLGLEPRDGTVGALTSGAAEPFAEVGGLGHPASGRAA